MPGEGPLPVFELNGMKVGIAICEDIWYPRVPSALAEAGAEMLIVPNGSPWRRTVQVERHTSFSAWTQDRRALPVREPGGRAGRTGL
jgi:NAD+ synthase